MPRECKVESSGNWIGQGGIFKELNLEPCLQGSDGHRQAEMSQEGIPGKERTAGKGWGSGGMKGPIIKLRGQKYSVAK